MPDTEQTTPRVRLAYGVGSVAYGVKDNGFSYLLLFYFFLWNPPSGLSPPQLTLWLFFVAILVLFPAAGGQMEPGGYQVYGWIAPGLMCTAILVSAAGTHHRIPTLKAPPARIPTQKAPPATAHHSLRIAFRELMETLSNPSIRVLFAGAIFFGVAAGLSASINIYVNTYFWGLDSEQIGLFSLSYFGSAMIALPLSPLLSRKFGKKRAAIGLSLLSLFMLPLVVSLRLLDIMPPNGTPALFFMLLVFNFIDVTLLVCSTTLISSMVADVVEESEVSTGRRSEGVFFAARTFALKIVSGAGIFSAAVILGWIGFPSDATGVADVTPEVLRRLEIVYVGSVGTLYGIAIFFYSRYRISRESHESHLRSLAERGRAETP
ncbi:MAG: hypothetical protein GY723_16245 [bacterium]|nr:hypothetical protein [bacterium]